MTLNDFSRSTLLAVLTLSCACSKAAPGQDPVRDAENARRDAEVTHRALAALPPACTLGSTASAPQGSWLSAPSAFSEPGKPYTFVQLFEAATTTGTVRAGLNRAALQVLDKVETRDAQGKWLDAGPVTVHGAPAGCDYVWLQQDLGSARQVEALRFTFHRSPDPVTLAEAGVLISR
jgi:hypothetical protein